MTSILAEARAAMAAVLRNSSPIDAERVAIDRERSRSAAAVWGALDALEKLTESDMTFYTYCAHCGARNDQAHYKGCETLAPAYERAMARDHEMKLQAVQNALTAAEIWFDVFVKRERARAELLTKAVIAARAALQHIPADVLTLSQVEAIDLVDEALAETK